MWDDANATLISARDQIVSECFDCILRFSLQFYQIWNSPEKI